LLILDLSPHIVGGLEVLDGYGSCFRLVCQFIFDSMPSGALEQILRDRIAASSSRSLTWADVMAVALYHPDCGYYGRGPRSIGRSGDFFTAVSVGSLYGRLLAGLAEKTWRALGGPRDFTIIEQGAHDGQLMEDVACGLEALSSPLAATARFSIVESNDKYRMAQAARLTPILGDRVTWVADLAALCAEPRHAFFMTNELLDAFPVHRVRWTGTEWVEKVVALSGDGESFVWRDAPLTSPCVKNETDRLPRDLAPDYTTEIHPAALDWVRQIGSTSFQGAVLVSDYGLDHAQYYSAERTDGTLRRYWNHKTDGNVLQNLGECDLTVHVNFTRLIEEAESSGFTKLACSDQGSLLTKLAAPWLRSLDGTAPSRDTAALLRQFQTLTHPGHMGLKFRMCLLGRGMGDASVPGPD
jgi:SAM-dependent MidA family methyltransferase